MRIHSDRTVARLGRLVQQDIEGRPTGPRALANSPSREYSSSREPPDSGLWVFVAASWESQLHCGQERCRPAGRPGWSSSTSAGNAHDLAFQAVCLEASTPESQAESGRIGESGVLEVCCPSTQKTSSARQGPRSDRSRMGHSRTPTNRRLDSTPKIKLWDRIALARAAAATSDYPAVSRDSSWGGPRKRTQRWPAAPCC